MKITFIGAGNMAEALVSGMVEKQVSSPTLLTVSDIAENRLKHFELLYGVLTTNDNVSAVKDADVIVLAVKPQIFPAVWPEISKTVKPNTLVISVMAGIPSSKIDSATPIRVVRIMPNTPALVGYGAAGIAAGHLANDDDVAFAKNMMDAVGESVVIDEKDLDAVTALSGSGPAYVFYLIESMMTAAEKMGLKHEDASKLTLATVCGAAELMKHSGESPELLRQNVTSKGGTTEAAIRTMDEHDVKEAIVKALLAAQSRSRELAQE